MPPPGDERADRPALGAYAWSSAAHKRSSGEWIDAAAYDADRRLLGVVVDVYDDPATLRPAWLAVATGFFGLVISVVPLRDARRCGDDVVIAHDRHTITTAPKARVVITIHPEQSQALFDHYAHHPNHPAPPAGSPD